MTAARDIVVRLQQEIAAKAKLEPGQVKQDAHFIRDLGLSSLDMLNVLAFAEKSYSVRFPDDVLAEMTTIDKVVEALGTYQTTATEEQQ